MADESDDVTWDDQQSINKFGRLNLELTELKAELEARKVVILPMLARLFQDLSNFHHPLSSPSTSRSFELASEASLDCTGRP